MGTIVVIDVYATADGAAGPAAGRSGAASAGGSRPAPGR